MNIAVRFGAEQVDLGVDPADERLVGFWPGQGGDMGDARAPEFRDQLARALAVPLDFPPLALAVVPGDRVAVALDLPADQASVAVAELARIFNAAEVAEFTVVANQPAPAELPPGVTWEAHDPDNRERIAYLATTEEGQRVYLNRALVDADFVLPIGTLGFDRALGHSGPWSALYPGLSDRETLTRFQGLTAVDPGASGDDSSPGLAESSEVGWLIGCQLQVGVLPGAGGLVLAGLESVVREQGVAAVDRALTFEVSERADVVIVGVGDPGPFATMDDLGAAFESATKLVRHGGKIVALAHLDGPLGPAVRRLVGVENPKAAPNRLRGHEAAPDYRAARQLAATLAWADVYLYSRLDSDLVEDLAIIPLGRATEAKKLANSAASLIVINQAARTHCRVADEAEIEPRIDTD